MPSWQTQHSTLSVSGCLELLKLALTFFRNIPLKRQHSSLPATECSAYSQHGIYTLSLTSKASLWKETKHNKMPVDFVSCSIFAFKKSTYFSDLGRGFWGDIHLRYLKNNLFLTLERMGICALHSI